MRNGGNGILLQGGSLTGCLIENNLVEKNKLGGISIVEDVQPANQGIFVVGQPAIVKWHGPDLGWSVKQLLAAERVCHKFSPGVAGVPVISVVGPIR